MRRILTAVSFYLMGLLTLPVLWWGTGFVSAESQPSDVKSRIITDSARPIATRAVAEVAETDSELVQRPLIRRLDDEVPLPTRLDTVVFDQPVPEPIDRQSEPAVQLPVRADMLAADTPDAADAEKLAGLRVKLREVIDEKAELLNAAALEAEIELHERQIMELRALQELQRLRQSLKELSDKYPDSEAGKRAKSMLMNLQPLNVAPPPTYPNTAPPFQPANDSFLPSRSPVPMDDEPFGGGATNQR